jgi:hypothetical protein
MTIAALAKLSSMTSSKKFKYGRTQGIR